MTGMSASISFVGAQHAEAVAVRQPQVRQHQRRLRLSAACRTASGWSRASRTAWPCRSRACRSIVRSESLSSTMRIWAGDELKARQSAQPARRHAGLARLLFDVGDLLLALLDVAASRARARRAPSGDRRRSARAATGSSRAAKSVGERVDPALQRLGEHFVAPESSRASVIRPRHASSSFASVAPGASFLAAGRPSVLRRVGRRLRRCASA